MVAQLEPRLRVASTQLQEAGEAMAILLQLQADGAPCVAQSQPIQLFLETLVCFFFSTACKKIIFPPPLFLPLLFPLVSTFRALRA